MRYEDEDDAIFFQIEEQPCEDDGRYRCGVWFARIDSFGSLMTETYGQGHFRY